VFLGDPAPIIADGDLLHLALGYRLQVDGASWWVKRRELSIKINKTCLTDRVSQDHPTRVSNLILIPFSPTSFHFVRYFME
jgi:hypothetical protein